MTDTNDDVSVKELIAGLKTWWKFMLSRWIIIVAFVLVGGGLGFTYALLKKPSYTGTLTFVLANDSKSGLGLAGIAGQFGIDVGGLAGGNGAFEGENIIQLLKSKKIITGALFKRVPGYDGVLANLIGEETGFFKKWKEKKRLQELVPFPEKGNLSPVQDSLVDEIKELLVRNYLDIAKIDKKLSFYSVKTTSKDERISSWLTQHMVSEASKMYLETKTKTARESLSMLQHEADSLRSRLSGVIYSTASTVDQTFNLNPAIQTQRASVQQNQLQVQALATAYGEVVKNLEIAKITLQKETPLFQIVDLPSLPLKQDKPGKAMCLITGLFLGGIFSIIFLLFSRFFNSLTKKNELG